MAIPNSDNELKVNRKSYSATAPPDAGRFGSGSRGVEAESDEGAKFDSDQALPPGLSQLAVRVEVVRMGKVSEIRAALAAGTYRVSAWDVAESMCALGWAVVVGRSSRGNLRGGAGA